MESNTKTIEIRRKAEELLKNKESKSIKQLSENEIQKLIYEYEVHQIELELMNEELKQKELTLIESENKYRTVFNNIQDIYYKIDLNGIILDISPSVTRFGEYIQEEMIGTDVSKYYYGKADRELFLNTIKQNGFVYDYELRFIIKSGSIKYTSVNAHIEYDNGKPVFIEGILRDITERKLAEKKLKESEERYRILSDQSPIAIEYFNEKGLLLTVNPACLRIFGVDDIKEIEGFNLFEDPNITEEIKQKLQRKEDIHYQDLFDFEKVKEFKLYNTTKSGTIWIDTNITPLKNNDGTFNGYLLHIIDITESKRAEEKLKESEERYKAIFESSHSVKLLINSDNGSIVDCNPAACKFYGWTHSELCSKTIYDLNILTKEEIYLKLMDAKASNKSNFVVNHRIASGDIRTIEVHSNPVAIGGVTLIYSLIHDITDVRKTEEALRESETNFRNIFDNAIEGMFRTSIVGKALMANPSLATMLGFDSAEDYLNNMNDSAHQVWVNTEDRYKYIALLEKHEVIKGFESQFKRRNGCQIWVSINAKMIKDDTGKPIYSEGFLEDITEQKNAEQALIKSEEKYRNIFENAQEGIFQTKVDGSYISVNPALANMYGFNSPEELINSRLDIAKDAYSDPKERDRFLEMMEKQEFVKGYEYEVKRKDGTKIWFYEDAKVIKDKNGRTKYFEGFVIDITERKLAEEELIKAKERAEASNRLKTAFLNNISHEIRTPLNGILGFASLIIEPDITEEQKNQYLKTLNNSGYRLIKTVSDYMDISLITSGNMDIHNTNFTINNLFDKLIKEHTQNYEDTDFALNIYLSEEIKTIQLVSDESLLINALGHLLDNAFKFTKQGVITLGAEIKDEHIVFYVKDTGKGIAKEFQDVIFNVFMQENVSNTRGYEGSGLGLSIVKGIMKLIGGDVSFESETDKGSIFYLSLPYSYPVKTDVNTNENKLVVLIAEDDEVSAELISVKIKKVCKEIIILGNGNEVVEKCRNNPDINLILLDVRMPGINGYEATRQIRQFNKDIIIIAQTAFGLHGDNEEAIKVGCNEYISKPIDFTLLMELIKKYFGS